MAEDIGIEAKVESMGIFIFLGVLLGLGGRGVCVWGNLKPLIPLALCPSLVPAMERAHPVAFSSSPFSNPSSWGQKKKGPRNQMSGWSTHWVNPSLLGVL